MSAQPKTIAARAQRQAETLRRVVEEISSELELRPLLTRIVSHACELLDAEAIYVYQGVPVSEACIDQSLGHDEREAIASYLAAL